MIEKPSRHTHGRTTGAIPSYAGVSSESSTDNPATSPLSFTPKKITPPSELANATSMRLPTHLQIIRIGINRGVLHNSPDEKAMTQILQTLDAPLIAA